MYVWRLRPARISTISQKVAFFYRENVWAQFEKNLPRLLLILLILYPFLQCRVKCIQMRIYCSKTIRVHNVYSPAKPEGLYLDAANVTIGSSIHRQVLPRV